ncbi:MAG TPA: heparinase II/III family protein [Candidatus Latescibacteria bacterium]|nr:heparinase II/III family protein [Candidatus Latescibacterota bacterium]HJP32024.1 heparinase II/III family protein [Candidatus Latescibacterota bacterium]
MILRSRQEVEQARENVSRYPWARDLADQAMAASQPFVDRTDEELWSLVTGQQVPRGIHVNPDLGCPSCGRRVYEEHGNYPWILDINRPFKIECPSCGQIWPKNDFDAWHESGLGPGGVFDRERADHALLVNEEHADATDPLRGHAVDDGLGWVDEEGQRWWFVAYFGHYCTWSVLPKAVTSLADAFLYTGDGSYAHKGLVLLDRIADVYPDMDLRPYSDMDLYNSHGGSGEGRLQGCIWETFISEGLSRAADVLLDAVDGDDELVDFLSAKAHRWQLSNDKTSPGRIRDNIRDGLLRQFIASVRDFRIRGNEGMTQTAMAAAAAVLDDPQQTPSALDWLFEPGARRVGGGHIPATLVGEVDRDGVGNEASPSYSFIWMNLFRRCAAVLERCREHRDYDLHRDYPRLRRMYGAPHRLTALDRYTPRIGDTGRAGDPGLISVDLETTIEVFDRFGETWAAQLAHRLNGDSVDGMHTSVFDVEPEAVQGRIAEVVDRAGPLNLASANLNGYGLAMLRHGAGDGRRAAWIYYGRNTGHGHRDRLNYGIYYRGMDLLPEMGYPEYADGKWPKRAGWTINTISHNTVVVNQRGQDGSWVGRCRMFAASAGASVIEIGCDEVYPETSDYRRTLAWIDVSDSESYLVDMFRVAGGQDHVLSFHSGDGTVTAGGLDLQTQERGTYAGPDIPFGEHYDGEPDGSYRGSGFSYLRNVETQSRPSTGWWVDWELEDTWQTRIGDTAVHLRYHGLSPAGDVSLAYGEPPNNKPGNPKQFRYLLQRNQGQDLRSLFVGVVEPYSGDRRTLQSVARLDLAHEGAAAVRVCTAEGRTDTVLSSDDGETTVDLGDGLSVAARFAWIGREEDGATEILVVGGTRVRLPEGELTLVQAGYTGIVHDFARDEAGPTWLDVAVDLPVADLPTDGRLDGTELRVLGDSPRDTCYTIEGVTASEAGRCRLDLGDTTLVRGFVDDQAYDAGVLYDVAVGDGIEILSVLRCRVGSGGCEILSGNVDSAWRAKQA